MNKKNICKSNLCIDGKVPVSRLKPHQGWGAPLPSYLARNQPWERHGYSSSAIVILIYRLNMETEF